MSKREPILTPMMVDLMSSAPPPSLPIPPLRVRDCCRESKVREQAASANAEREMAEVVRLFDETQRLRAALQRIVDDRRTSPTAWEVAKDALRTTSAKDGT